MSLISQGIGVPASIAGARTDVIVEGHRIHEAWVAVHLVGARHTTTMVGGVAMEESMIGGHGRADRIGVGDAHRMPSDDVVGQGEGDVAPPDVQSLAATSCVVRNGVMQQDADGRGIGGIAKDMQPIPLQHNPIAGDDIVSQDESGALVDKDAGTAFCRVVGDPIAVEGQRVAINHVKPTAKTQVWRSRSVAAHCVAADGHDAVLDEEASALAEAASTANVARHRVAAQRDVAVEKKKATAATGASGASRVAHNHIAAQRGSAVVEVQAAATRATAAGRVAIVLPSTTARSHHSK
jgi:hypothetical protein